MQPLVRSALRDRVRSTREANSPAVGVSAARHTQENLE